MVHGGKVGTCKEELSNINFSITSVSSSVTVTGTLVEGITGLKERKILQC